MVGDFEVIQTFANNKFPSFSNQLIRSTRWGYITTGFESCSIPDILVLSKEALHLKKPLVQSMGGHDHQNLCQ